MKLSQFSAVSFAITFLLSGCGGGGGGSSATGTPAPSIAALEGAYEGTISSGGVVAGEFELLVLENGQFYALAGTTSGGVFRVVSLLEGVGISNNGVLSASNVREYAFDGSVVTESINGTYVPGVSVNAVVTAPGSLPATVAGVVYPSANYNYNTAAQLSQITGNWSGTDLFRVATNFNITAGGIVTGTSAGCSFSGSVMPRASGRNVFDVTLSFGAAPCALPGATVSGAAVTSLLPNGQRQLLVAGVNAARTAGNVVFAVR